LAQHFVNHHLARILFADGLFDAAGGPDSRRREYQSQGGEVQRPPAGVARQKDGRQERA